MGLFFCQFLSVGVVRFCGFWFFFFFVEGNVILLSLEKNFFRSTMHYIEMIISKLLGPIIFGMSF